MSNIEIPGSLMSYSNLPMEEIRKMFTEEQFEYLDKLAQNEENYIYIHRAGYSSDEEKSFFEQGLAITPMYSGEPGIDFTASNCGNKTESLLDQIIGAAGYKGTEDVYILQIPRGGVEYRKGQSVPILYTKKNENGTYVNPEYIKAVVKLPRTDDGRIEIIKRDDMKKELDIQEIEESQKKYEPDVQNEFAKQNEEAIREECKKIVRILKEKFPNIKWPKKISLDDLRISDHIGIKFYFNQKSRKKEKNEFIESLRLLGSDIYEQIINLLKDENGQIDWDKYRVKDENDTSYGKISYLSVFMDIQKTHSEILEQNNINYLDFFKTYDEEIVKAILGLEQVQKELGVKDLKKSVIKSMLDKERNGILPTIIKKKSLFERLKEMFSKKNHKKQGNQDNTENGNNIENENPSKSRRQSFLAEYESDFKGEINIEEMKHTGEEMQHTGAKNAKRR